MSSVWSDLGDFVDEHFDAVVQRPIRIIGIIVVTLVLRALAHRLIDRLANASAEGAVPALLRPLRDRAASSGLFGDSSTIGERRRQRAETIASVLKSAASFALFVIAVLYVLAELDFSLAPLLAGTSIVGVAIGFGAQNIIKDFLGGMFMILEDQYGVGDVIDLKDATGTVEAVGLRTTRLRDEGGTVWYMRNGEIVRVGNHSQGFAQVVLDVPIKPDGDVARAESVMRAVAASIAADPEWTELFLEDPRVLGIQSITLEATTIRLTARVRPLEQWRVARELRGRIRQSLDDAGTPAAAMPDPDPDPAMPAAPAAPPSPAALALSVDPAVAP
ncbi:MAG: mscS [Jatrophihabitantaceae bacterium]|nr:mscS [Jatrophihabitantaceae bacterium]